MMPDNFPEDKNVETRNNILKEVKSTILFQKIYLSSMECRAEKLKYKKIDFVFAVQHWKKI